MQATGKFAVSEAPKGVYIFTENRNCIIPKFWGLHENEEKPVGAIILSEHNLIVALSGSEDSIKLLYYPANQTNPKFENIEEDVKDFNGKEETKVLSDLGSKAAQFCLDYCCGNIEKGEWYLPTAGELQLMYDHRKELDLALAICGGDGIETDDWHWSSTRRYDKSNWVLNWLYGSRGDYDQDYYCRVRPVSAFL